MQLIIRNDLHKAKVKRNKKFSYLNKKSSILRIKPNNN